MKIKRQHTARVQGRMTVVGVFDDDQLAEQAIRELSRVGFGESQIRVSLRGGHEWRVERGTEQEAHAGSSPLAGSGSVGLAGVSVLAAFVPLIGSAFAAGTSDGTISSAVAAAGVASVVGALIGAGVPAHEARYYRDEFEAGRTIVTVAAGSREREARAILRRHGSYDMISGILSSKVS
jgi:hypothetical protein